MNRIIVDYEKFAMEQQFASYVQSERKDQERLFEIPISLNEAHNIEAQPDINAERFNGGQYFDYSTNTLTKNRKGQMVSTAKVNSYCIYSFK